MEPRSQYLSASRIKTLRDCPMKFYISYCAPERIEMPNSWGAANGTILHEIFEEYASGSRRDWKQNLLDKFRAAMYDPNIIDSVFKFAKGVKTTLADEIVKSRRSCGKCPFANIMSDGSTVFCKAMGKTTTEFVGSPKKMISDTVKLAKVIFDNDFNPIDDLKVIGVEHKFEVTFENGVSTLGFIDLISEIDEETIEIRDYKSAKRVPSDKDIDEGWINRDVQMQLYYAVAKYCCDHNIPPFSNKYKNILVTIHFLRKTPITMVYTSSDYSRILRMLKKAYNDIRAAENPLPEGMWGRNHYWICNYCNKDECNKACLELHGKTREELASEHSD